jgi:hypothetical protein
LAHCCQGLCRDMSAAGECRRSIRSPSPWPNTGLTPRSARSRRGARDCRPGSSCGSPRRAPISPLVQHQAVIDRERRRDGGHRTPAPGIAVGMRPVAAPHDAIGIGAHQQLRDRRRLGEIGTLLRDPVGAGNLDVGMPRLSRSVIASIPAGSARARRRRGRNDRTRRETAIERGGYAAPR